jgi:acyl carrier protein
MDATYQAIRQLLIDWLDDNYHFGEAAGKIQDDEMSFLQNGVLNSLGFVSLIVHLEDTFGIRIDRKKITRENFDGLGKIIRFVTAHPQFKGVP